MRTLQIISVNHQSHSKEARAKLQLCKADSKRLTTYIRYQLQAEGVVVLSTCNRMEIYLECDRDVRMKVVDKWMLLANQDSQQYRDNFKTHYGTEIVVRYILQLSVGLKSAIYGDDQILTQIKKAFEESRSQAQLSTLLERAYQILMRYHKAVCNSTDFRSQSISLAYHSLKQMVHDLGRDKARDMAVLIIGAGDMAQQVVKYISKFEFGQVSLTNRSVDKAIDLAAGTPIHVAHYGYGLAKTYDIIISCTDFGHERVGDFSDLQYYLDLSLWSMTADEVDCRHRFLSELQQGVDQSSGRRLSAMPVIKRLLGEHVATFAEWHQGWVARRATIIEA